MSKSIEVVLREPIEQGTETITKIVVSKPKGKHFKKLPLEPETIDDLWGFTCAICSQPPSVLDELSAEDFTELMDIVGNFIPGGHPTGEK